MRLLYLQVIERAEKRARKKVEKRAEKRARKKAEKRAEKRPEEEGRGKGPKRCGVETVKNRELNPPLFARPLGCRRKS